MNPTLTYIISLKHATAMIKKMHQKKHRGAGYSFELEDLSMRLHGNGMPKATIFAEYAQETPIYLLKIYYEKPHETPLTNKNRVSRRVPRK